jgi:hypothetical protein
MHFILISKVVVTSCGRPSLDQPNTGRRAVWAGQGWVRAGFGLGLGWAEPQIYYSKLLPFSTRFVSKWIGFFLGEDERRGQADHVKK